MVGTEPAANAAGSTPNRAAYAASLEGPATPEARAATQVAAGGGTSGTRPGAAAVSKIDDKLEFIFMCKCTLCVPPPYLYNLSR